VSVWKIRCCRKELIGISHFSEDSYMLPYTTRYFLGKQQAIKSWIIWVSDWRLSMDLTKSHKPTINRLIHHNIFACDWTVLFITARGLSSFYIGFGSMFSLVTLELVCSFVAVGSPSAGNSQVYGQGVAGRPTTCFQHWRHFSLWEDEVPVVQYCWLGSTGAKTTTENFSFVPDGSKNCRTSHFLRN
jgi:hypothetical protein